MRRLVVAAAAVLVLSGCAYHGAESLPLPGAIGGSGTYQVTVVFADATNLVPKESCRANDTIVGSVLSIQLDRQLHARVVCSIKNSVTLPGNAIATLRETSLLGERYVDFDPPMGVAARGRLQPGAVVAEDSSHADPDAEMVLGALSQLLNGGSLGSLDTITSELGTALSTSDLRGTVHELSQAVGQLASHRGDIVHTLQALNRLTGDLSRQRQVIAETLDAVPKGLAVLDRQRPKLIATLQTLTALSSQAVPLIQQSKANSVADLRHLAPVLEKLSTQSHQIAQAVEALATFPFPHNSESLIKGDYGGMFANFSLNVAMLNKLLGIRAPAATSQTAAKGSTASGVRLPLKVPGLGGLGTTLGGTLGTQSGSDPLNLGQLLGGGL